MKISVINPIRISNSVKYITQKTSKIFKSQPQESLLPNSWKKSKTIGLTTDQLIDLILRNL